MLSPSSRNRIDMKPFEKLSVEIFELILDWVIRDTLLLSTSPIDHSWTFDSAIADWICPIYAVDGLKRVWLLNPVRPALQEFRRVKTRLRLVCRSWREYVDSPRLDRLHITLCVPRVTEDTESACKALESKSSVHNAVSAYRLDVISPHLNPSSELDGVMSQISRNKRRLAVKILIDVGGAVSNRMLNSHPWLFPNLTALHINLSHCPKEQLNTLDFARLLPKLSSLTCLSLRIRSQFSSTIGMFRSESLGTLNIACPLGMKIRHIDSWSLPSLNHLQFIGIEEEGMESFESILSLSHHLKTISLQTIPHILPGLWIEPDLIWRKCPNLTNLEIRVKDIFMQKLPKDCPLTHFINKDICTVAEAVVRAVRTTGNIGVLCRFEEFCSSASRLRTITDRHYWRRRRECPIEVIMAKRLGTFHIRYEDVKRRSLDEYERSL
jgi:hypothetical protein